MVLSTHVDDLKGAGKAEEREALLKALELKFGKLKISLNTFENVGVMHEQDKQSKQVRLHQDHYVRQLRPMSLDEVAMVDDDDDASPAFKATFLSIVGGLAWCLLTCPAVAVYVSYLQRQMKEPKVKHLRDANRVVRWLQKTPQGIVYVQLPLPVILMVATDSAYTAGEFEGLSLRGMMLMLVSTAGDANPGGQCQLIDYFALRQPHVTRSTYAAELHAALDGANQALVVGSVLTEIKLGATTAAALADLQESGRYALPMHLGIDAKSVFTSVIADHVQTSADKALLVHALKLREWLNRKIVSVLWWLDTRDMVTDGMTKGSVDRAAILAVARGSWKFVGDVPARYPKRGRHT